MTSFSPYRRAGAVADLLGLSVRTVRRRIADGDFPSVKIGGARLVDVPALARRYDGLDLLEMEDEVGHPVAEEKP